MDTRGRFDRYAGPRGDELTRCTPETIRHAKSLTTALQITALLCMPAAAVQPLGRAAVVWRLVAPDAPVVRPGQRLDIRLRAVVERGWYLYAAAQPASGPTALRITVPDGQPFAPAGPVKAPAPTRAWDEAFEAESAKHDGTVTFLVPVQVAATAAPGAATLKVEVRYQACSETVCLRPKTETLSLAIEIRGP